MAIYRAPRPDTHFTTIRNDVLRDDRLSYRARGILAVILSRPDDWSTTSEALARAGIEGRDAIRTALTELEDAGYLRREKRQDDRGRWSTQAVMYDTPQTPVPRTEQGALFGPTGTPTDTDGSPGTDSQASVSQSSENQAPIEGLTTKTSPDGEGDPPPTQAQVANAVAAVVYEHLDKMGNFMAIRQVAGRAIKAGHQPETVQAAMCQAVDDSRPLTGQVVRDYLRSGERPGPTNTHAGHWANGGQFTEGGQ